MASYDAFVETFLAGDTARQGNQWTNGQDLMSYATLLARRHPEYDGIAVNTNFYSPTTSAVQAALKRALAAHGYVERPDLSTLVVTGPKGEATFVAWVRG